MVDPSEIFIDGTHIKASANKKKYQKAQVKKAAKVYSEQLRQEVNAEREKLGKKPIEDDSDDDFPDGGETVEKTVSTTDPDSGVFSKGEHEKQFAYEAHTACDFFHAEKPPHFFEARASQKISLRSSKSLIAQAFLRRR